MDLLKLSNNAALPPIAAWKVKSFWLMLLTVLFTALNASGIDLRASLCDAGLGCTPDQIVDTGSRAVNSVQLLIPIITGIWTWIERRAPHYRLVFWGAPK